MGRARLGPGYDNRKPWNAGRLVGAKRPFTVKQIWAIRFHLDHEQRLRDRALLDLAIDSKLRGCDLVKLRIGNLRGAYPTGKYQDRNNGSLSRR